MTTSIPNLYDHRANTPAETAGLELTHLAQTNAPVEAIRAACAALPPDQIGRASTVAMERARLNPEHVRVLATTLAETLHANASTLLDKANWPVLFPTTPAWIDGWCAAIDAVARASEDGAVTLWEDIPDSQKAVLPRGQECSQANLFYEALTRDLTKLARTMAPHMDLKSSGYKYAHICVDRNKPAGLEVIWPFLDPRWNRSGLLVSAVDKNNHDLVCQLLPHCTPRKQNSRALARALLRDPQYGPIDPRIFQALLPVSDPSAAIHHSDDVRLDVLSEHLTERACRRWAHERPHWPVLQARALEFIVAKRHARAHAAPSHKM